MPGHFFSSAINSLMPALSLELIFWKTCIFYLNLVVVWKDCRKNKPLISCHEIFRKYVEQYIIRRMYHIQKSQVDPPLLHVWYWVDSFPFESTKVLCLTSAALLLCDRSADVTNVFHFNDEEASTDSIDLKSFVWSDLPYYFSTFFWIRNHFLIANPF